MKYILLLGDGMADFKDGVLYPHTPLEIAQKPNMDNLAKRGMVGLISTIPKGLKPGSDVANLSVLGYAPELYYTGRSPLEAFSIGIDLKDTDVALRTNLVTLSSEEKFECKTMIDYSAGEISTAEARELISAVNKELSSDKLSFYCGVSYRHCLIAADGNLNTNFTPPHDISDKVIGSYLPCGEDGEMYLNLIKASETILKNHPINQSRVQRGLSPATHVWFWGAGTKPMLPSFQEKYGLNGVMVSAVDLLKGIAICAKMRSIDVPNVTGNLDTNFVGKADAVLKALSDGADYAYLHYEAPDECGHKGEASNKVLAIEKIDEMLGKIITYAEKHFADYTIAVLPDHATPLSLKTHVSDPVPFILYNNKNPYNSNLKYTEEDAKKGVYLEKGDMLIKKMIEYNNDRI